MTGQYQFPKSLEGFALDQTEQFLKPRTFVDLLFLFLLVFWWMTSFLFPNNTIFRASMFGGLIVLFIFIPLYIFFAETEKSAASPLNRAIKILMFYILILIFTPDFTLPNLWDSSFSISYGELERAIVCVLFPLTIIWNGFSPRTLKIGYLFYIQRILQSCWLATLILYIFKGIYLFHPITILPLDFDLLLLIAFGMFLIGNLIPVAPKELSLSATDLFDQYQALKTQKERLRDAFLFGSVCLLIFLFLQWIGSSYIELFQYIAFLSLFIGIILIFTPERHNKRKFGSFLDSISGQAQVIDPTSNLGNRVHNFAQTIQATKFEKPERVYTIPTDGMRLISKGKTTVSASKGTIAVPTVTDKGTALVLMGKSELETKSENQETSTKKEIEGTTTLWLQSEEWDNIQLQLNPIEMSDLTQNEMKDAGIDAATEIFEKTKKALNDLKSWRGPQGIFSSVLDETPSKYAIEETEDYSRVRLPGVYVFESKNLELVNILGGLVKVIDMKGVGQYVQVFGGFVTVLETSEYTFVQTPFVSVIDTPKGERVRVFGIDIQEGEKIDLEEMRSKIIQDKSNLDQLFTKRVETLFEEDPQLLLTDSKGEKLGFLVGEDEVLSDTTIRDKGLKGLKGLKGIKGIERHDSKRRRKHPPSPSRPPSVREHKHLRKEKRVGVRFKKGLIKTSINKQPSSDVVTLDLDTEGVPKDDPQLQEIEAALTRVEESINVADEKFLNNEISESKHTEIIDRLKARKDQLIKEKDEIENKLKLKFV